MTSVAKLTADLSLNSSSFETGLNRASGKFSTFSRQTQSLINSNARGFAALNTSAQTAVGTFLSLKAGIAAVIGAAGLTALIKQQVSAASAIKDTADRLQLGTTALQKYQYAAKQAGIDNETLEQAIGKLNAKIADGSLKYKSVGDGLNSIADAVKKAKTEQERLAIVNDNFGDKLGKKVLPLLLGGAEGLRKLGDEAQRTGNVIKDSTIQSADELGDNLDALISTIQNNFSQGFLDHLVGQSSDLRDVYTDPQFAEGIRNLGNAFGDFAAAIIKAASALGQFIGWYERLSADIHKWDQETWDKIMDAGSRAFDSPANRQKFLNRKNAVQYPLKVGEVYGPVISGGAGSTNDIPTGKPSGYKKTGKTNKEQADGAKSILDGLKKETDQLQTQVALYGQKQSVIDRAVKASQIQNQLAAQGITLTDKQKEQMNEYLDLMQQQQDLQEEQRKYHDEVQDFTNAVSSSFEDAIFNGEKLSDVFNSLAKDIAKMAFKANILNPLFGDGSAGSSGLLTGLLGNAASFIFGAPPSLPSHATGQRRVPYDMTARLHKNEEVIPASEAMRGGDAPALKVNVIDRNDSKVGVNQPRKTPDGLELDIMVDRAVAKNITKKGTATNQSLKKYQAGNTIIRR